MVYQTTQVLPDPDTEVSAHMSGEIPVIEFGYQEGTGSTVVHVPGKDRELQAAWLTTLSAALDALAERLLDLGAEKVQ